MVAAVWFRNLSIIMKRRVNASYRPKDDLMRREHLILRRLIRTKFYLLNKTFRGHG